jgi:Lon protease-like protein
VGKKQGSFFPGKSFYSTFGETARRMTNFIPIFPLGIVVYPGEALNLHIFEPRYKQLIADCLEKKQPFGIPSVIDNKVNEMGTLVQVKEVSKQYENGELDIQTEGVKVFRILEVIKSIPDKRYSGAIVNYPENNFRGDAGLMGKVLLGVRRLHALLDTGKTFAKDDTELISYDVAHHAGLTQQQEYELLELLHELQRQEYLKQHLAQAIPLAQQLESLKEKIRQNGHFKNLPGFEW